MGCVSSSLLNQEDDDYPHIGSNAFSHHFVSLTSTTYGLLTLDHPPPSPSPSPSPSPMTPPTPPHRFTLSQPEIINSWELMAGLDSNSNSNSNSNFKPSSLFNKSNATENTHPNIPSKPKPKPKPKPQPLTPDLNTTKPNYSLEKFPNLCPPDGHDKVVLYTTSLRGIRKTFEACNSVRSTLRLLGYAFCERDISMDRGFKDELNRLFLPQMLLPPRLFIKGRYVGGAEDVIRIHEEGGLLKLLQGLPRLMVGSTCDGCGDARFLPCFRCNGSCKLIDHTISNSRSRMPLVLRCPDCNENGLVLCPICS